MVGDRRPRPGERHLQVGVEGEDVAHRAWKQWRKQGRLPDAASLADGSAGLDEGDHVALEAEIDHAPVLERAHPRTDAGVVGDELHAAAALLTAAWIFT